MNAEDIRTHHRYTIWHEGREVTVSVDRQWGIEQGDDYEDRYTVRDLKTKRLIRLYTADAFLKEVPSPASKAKAAVQKLLMSQGVPAPEAERRVERAVDFVNKYGAQGPPDHTERPNANYKAVAAAFTETGRFHSPVPNMVPIPRYDPEPGKLGIGAKLAAARAKAAQPLDIPHCLVIARAGCGKTFTLVAGICWTVRHIVKGLWQDLEKRLGFRVEPSDQQLAVWEQMLLSHEAKTVTFGAFNNTIVDEFSHKWGWVVSVLQRSGIKLEFATMHRLGFRAVRSNFKLHPDEAVNNFKTSDLVAEILATDIRKLRKDRPTLVTAVAQLAGLCKQNLVDGTEENLAALVTKYSVELLTDKDKAEAFALVPEVLDRCRNPEPNGQIDFADQVWLPNVLGLPMVKSDLFLGDEVQDWSRAQQELATKAGKRLVLCGDDRQALYGFAGADSDSIPRQKETLSATSQGLVTLPLTVTRRCGKTIVAEARNFIEDFEAHPGNPAGKIMRAKYPIQGKRSEANELPYEATYLPLVQDGDFVLCRSNAPLVSQCFKFLKRGRKAYIQGKKDIGAQLVSMIRGFKVNTVEQLTAKIQQWATKERTKEQAKKHPSEDRLAAIADKQECLACFCEGLRFAEEVVVKIEGIFTDDRNAQGIRLSSIHKAKGLEAKRVFFLVPACIPCRPESKMRDWEIVAEDNLRYVAITRAIEELWYVT